MRGGDGRVGEGRGGEGRGGEGREGRGGGREAKNAKKGGRPKKLLCNLLAQEGFLQISEWWKKGGVGVRNRICVTPEELTNTLVHVCTVNVLMR